MNLKILSLLLPIGLLAFSCSSKGGEIDYVAISKNLNNKFFKEIECIYDIKYLGGGGGYINTVNLVSLTFSIGGKYDLKSARHLIVKLTEDLLHLYNDSSEIRPYLKNYPFNTSNVCIVLIFDKNLKQQNELNIESLANFNSSIVYVFNGPEEKFEEINKDGLINLPSDYDPNPLQRKLASNSRVGIHAYCKTAHYYETYDEAFKLVYGHDRCE